MMSIRAILALFFLVVIFNACELIGTEPPSALDRVPITEILKDSMAVTANPGGRAPLTAEAVFETRAPTRVTIEVLGEEPVVHHFDEPATSHAVPMLGLYPDTDNRVVVQLTDPERGIGVDTLHIATGPLPETFPAVNIVRADTARMEDGWTLSGLSVAGGGGVWQTVPIMYDDAGAIRWYLDLSFMGGLAIPIRRLNNGHLLAGRDHDIYELDMLGREIRHLEIPGFLQHHELLEKPDGNLIVAVSNEALDTISDYIIEVDRTSGAVVDEWDLRQVLDVHRSAFSSNRTDWFHMNAIYYDEADDALIVSGRNQGVVKVTRDNELVWILAPHKGWGPAGPDGDGPETSDFLLTAVDPAGNPYPEAVQMGDEDAADFSWSWGQHASFLLPNGHLFVFDNGATRNFTDGPTFSRGVEYAIDEEAMTVQQVWQYGKERGDAFYSSIISDVDLLPETGNRLIAPGIVQEPGPRALVDEVTYPDKEVVFEASIEFRNLNGTGQGWGEMDIVYRSERMLLYPP